MEGIPPPDSPHVKFDTPSRTGAQVDGSDVLIAGGPVTSPQPSDKERLAQSCGVGLFDIAGLATIGYHGGLQRPGPHRLVHSQLWLSNFLEHGFP